MIKRTPYFGNPAYLRTKDEQLVFEGTDSGGVKLVPIEYNGILNCKSNYIRSLYEKE